MDIKIFIHNPGEEFWLIWTALPLQIVTTRLPIQSDKDNLGLIRVCSE
jgi:hypothetical protein